MLREESNVVIMKTNALVTKRKANLIQLVQFFENGIENVYLIDEEGRYRWMYPLEPIVFTEKLNKENIAELRVIGEKKIIDKGLSEVSVVDMGGRIVRVVRTKKSDINLVWENLSEDVVLRVLRQFTESELYVTSRNNVNIANFISYYGNNLQIKDLTEANIYEVISGKGTVLYDSDIFPECHKISVKELYEKCKREIEINDFAKTCILGEDWVSFDIGKKVTVHHLLNLFDEGCQAVHFESDSGMYQGSLSISHIREFLKNGCKKINLENLGIPYTKDESFLRNAWANMLLGSGNHEAVFIKNGKIVSNGVYWVGRINGLSERRMMLRQKTYWNMIRNDVAMDFFGHKCKILLSSTGGVLSGFWEKFGNLYNVEIFNSKKMNDYMEGKYDYLIFGADLWPKAKTKAYSGRLLYVDLLSESLRRYWQDNGIAYYACDVQVKPKNIADRQTNERTRPEKHESPSIWQGLREDYVFHADYNGDDFIKVIGSHRIDAPRLPHYTRTVWMTGPCIAFGESAPFGETIEAVLQKKLNEIGMLWRVVNCGSYGTRDMVFSDFNTLNYLMDLPMRKGDVIIHFTQYLWKNIIQFKIRNFFTTSDAFDDSEHISGKYWYGTYPAHMNKYGYEVWAACFKSA